MNVEILFVLDREIKHKREAVLIVRRKGSNLKLVVKQEYIPDLFSEFKIKKIHELAGKEAVLDLDTQLIYRKQRRLSVNKMHTPVTCEISIVN